MFGFDEGQRDYDRVQNDQTDHEGKFSHELLAGGASFLAMKEFENHQRSEGKTVDHGMAKELLAGFAGAEVDKLAETKGADYIDRERAKHEARRNTEQMYDQHYGQYDQYDPQQQQPHEHLRNRFDEGERRGGW